MAREPVTDWLGWTKAEIKAGHPIENARERAAWKVYSPKRGSVKRGGSVRRKAFQSSGISPAAFVAGAPRKSGANVGSFKTRKGSWKKGKGGRFVGSGG